MAARSFCDLINEAWLSGKEAVIEYNGNTYVFDPEGLLDFINANVTVAPPTSIDATIIDFSNVPTADPVVAGALWNNNGVLTISTGV